MKPHDVGIQSAWAAWGALFIGLVFFSVCCWSVYEWFHEPSWRKGREAVSHGLLGLLMLYYGHVGRQYVRQSQNQQNQTEDNSISDNTARLEQLGTDIPSTWAAWVVFLCGLYLFIRFCFTLYEWLHEPSWRNGIDAIIKGFLGLMMLRYWHVTRQYIRQSKNQPNQTEDNSISDNT